MKCSRLTLRRLVVLIGLFAAGVLWEYFSPSSPTTNHLIAPSGSQSETTHATDSTSSQSFTVVSWNLKWFPSGYTEPQPENDEQKRISYAARYVRRNGVPDIFFVQEIRNAQISQKWLEQFDDPALKLVICSNYIFEETQEPSYQQLAIFSRFPVLEARYEPWHTYDFVTPPRGFAYALLQVNEALVACLNVHLKSNYVPEGQDPEAANTLNRMKRELATQQLLAFIKKLESKGYQGKPIQKFIVAGDFNNALNDPRFEQETSIRAYLEAGFQNAFEGYMSEEYASLPANDWYPAATFDYILTKGFERAAPPETLPKYFTSDHRPVRATLH